jgi:hypothetical protein
MSGAFQNIDPPHPLSARRVCNTNPPPLVRGEDTLAGWRGGGGSIVWKTPDTALYSIICKYFVLLSVISLLLTAILGGYIFAQTAQRLTNATYFFSFLTLTFLNSPKQNLKLGINFDIYGRNLIFQIKQKILIDDYNFVAHC